MSLAAMGEPDVAVSCVPAEHEDLAVSKQLYIRSRHALPRRSKAPHSSMGSWVVTDVGAYDTNGDDFTTVDEMRS